jgi:CO/xanthine dehydrogenase FAD-binding subunit
MRLLPKFDFYEPESISEACKVLAQLKSKGKIIAGGTDILVNMKKGVISPKYLVSLGKIPELSGIEPVKGGVAIGANVIISKVAEFNLLKKKFSVLSKAASVLGSPLIRNRATIGGNLVNARPAADMPPPLMVMGAKVVLVCKGSKREVSLDNFFVGPGKTKIKPNEILTKIIINDVPPYTGWDYLKLMHRDAVEIAIVAVAVRITLDKPNGIIKNAKVILSSVAPRAIHSVSAEKALVGEKPTENLFKKAASLASTDCTPIDDIRGGAEYRCAMVEALTNRALLASLKQIKSK